MRYLICLLITVIAPSCDRAASPEARELAKTIRKADNIIIFHNSSETGRKVSATISRTVLEAMRVHDGVAEGFQCLCYADYVITWYQDGNPTCELGFQPDVSLSWPNGPFFGDIQLSEEAGQALYAEILTSFESGTTIPNYKPPIPE